MTSEPTHVCRDGAQRAWDIWNRKSNSTAVAAQVEVIADKHRSGVYCLKSAGEGGRHVIAKRGFPERIAFERSVYIRWLSRLLDPGVRLLDHAEDTTGAAWLFFEYAEGAPFDCEDRDHRSVLAEWVATLHTTAREWSGQDGLPDRGPDFFLSLVESTIDQLQERSNADGISEPLRHGIQETLEVSYRLADAWSRIQQACCVLPPTFIHGDLLPKNMRVSWGNGSRLAVFDWEYAGWGSPVIDLAQSVSEEGRWSAPVLSIYQEAIERGGLRVDMDELRYGASVARLLHLVLWTHGDARNLRGEWIDRPVMKLAEYGKHTRSILQELAL